MTPKQRVDRIMAEAVGSDLSSWEKHEFMPSIAQRSTLTPRQEEILSQIEIRIFGDDD